MDATLHTEKVRARSEEATAGLIGGARWTESRRDNALDGFRGCAVLIVIVFHFLSHRGLGWLGYAGSVGWTGVDAFLVLSAYLITSILYRQRGSPGIYRRFYYRRALRLFPLYYFILVLALALTPIFHLHWRLGHIPYFLYATNYVLPWHQPLGGLGPLNFRHYWTLALEEQFYLVWPWVVGSRLSREALVRICWGGIFVALGLRLWLVHIGANNWMIYESLPTRMDSLLAGALLALCPLPSVRTAWSALVAAAVAFTAVVFTGRTAWFTGREVMEFGYTILAVLYSAALTLALSDGTVVRRFLSQGWLRFFGRYSYGLYLWHYIFSEQVRWFNHWMAKAIPLKAAASLISFLVVLGLATLVAVASFHLIEAPFLRMKRRYES